MGNRKIWIPLLAVVLAAALTVGAFAAKKVINKVYEILDSFAALSEVLVKVDYMTDEMRNGILTVTEDKLGGRIKLAQAELAYDFDYSWVHAGNGLIAHAMGGIQGDTYTNSREAFLENYAKGYRIFEVDFSLTAPENTLIASHDAEELKEDYPTFMGQKVQGKYTPLDYRDVLALMREYPDIYVVTDTKYTDKSSVQLAFAQLVRQANATDPEVLERIIPQIYNEEMLQWVMDAYPFRSVIYTLYYTVWTPQSVYDFCLESNVRFVTTQHDWVREADLALWKELGVTVAAFTVNDEAYARQLEQQGVEYFYTDFLDPGAFA